MFDASARLYFALSRAAGVVCLCWLLGIVWNAQLATDKRVVLLLSLVAVLAWWLWAWVQDGSR